MGYNKMKKYLIVLFLILVCVSIINSQERCKNDIFYQYIENKESNEISLNVIKQSAYKYWYEFYLKVRRLLLTTE